MNRNILDNKALFYIKKIKGINVKTLAEAMDILEAMKKNLEVRELVKVYTPDKITGLKSSCKQLKIDNINLVCEEFGDLQVNWIERITIYMISIPQIKDMECGDMVTAFYVDIWQNAYINGARDVIKEKSEADLSFGPGYYGMDIKENEKFYNLLEGGRIGVNIKDKIIYPEKTCTGLFIKIKEEYRDKIKKRNPCKYCKGNRLSCDTCGVERRDYDTSNFFTNE